MGSEARPGAVPLPRGAGGHGRILLVFIDGLGLGPADPAVNALVAARLPALRALLGGAPPVLESAGASAAGATLIGLDATLGMAGLPQSGTGQAALLTGEDAPALFGRHFGPWVPVALRPLVHQLSLLARARAAGARVAFANAYPEELLALAAEPLARGDLARLPGPLRAGPPLAALGAGALTRHTRELERGEAVSSELVHDACRQRLKRTGLPVVTPEQAGRNLAAIAGAHDLTLYAHYTTDAAGHHRELALAIVAVERVDAFLAGVLEALPADVLLVVASDHGNLEDCRAGHTRNPALFLAAGPGHTKFARGLTSLTDVAPRVLEWLAAP